MSLYGGAIRSAEGNSPNGPIIEIINTATDYCALFELGLMLVGSSNMTIGIGQSVTPGVPRPNGISLLPLSIAATSFIQLVNGWTTPPVNPANYFKRFSIASGLRGTYPLIFRFPLGLKMAPATSLVLVDITATGAGGAAGFTDIWVEIDG